VKLAIGMAPSPYCLECPTHTSRKTMVSVLAIKKKNAIAFVYNLCVQLFQ